MMKRGYVRGRFLCTLVLTCLAAAQVFSQDFNLGAILDAERYNSLPQKAVLSTRSYANLPAEFSLKAYAPLPGDQEEYGTCVAWASAYAARTISESVAINRQNRNETTRNVFSPAFIYRIITDDPTCQSGAAIFWALDAMKDQGAVKMLEIERSTDFRKINLSYFTESRKYPISDYVTLFRRSDDWGPDENFRIQAVKKSLSEGKPVIIGMNCPQSFMRAQDVWRPRESPDGYYGGHAMCVVGYDDNQNGGAFEVQNSWGKQWGNGGFIWIPYSVFGRFVLEAYEMIENLAAYKDATRYSGFARVEFYGGGEMPVRLNGEGYYRTLESYPSGTEFRFLLGSEDPAYVYAFAADSSTAATTQIFPPPGSSVSPVLDYSENTIVWPGERQWIQLDDTAGTDYLVVLFSKQALKLDPIRRRFEEARGSLTERTAQAVGSDFIPFNLAEYGAEEIRFSAQTANSRAVFALLLAIEHHRED